jgi:predicted lipoprotein with Yx(FWY)xxD motif
MGNRFAVTVALCVLAVSTPVVDQAAGATSAARVRVISVKPFGKVLATPASKALYTWNREIDHKVHCTGTCARAWPPLLVKGTHAAIARSLAGIKGTFGVVTRPDGSRQLTLDRAPLYTYAGDAASQVLCDGQDGWHVVRAR